MSAALHPYRSAMTRGLTLIEIAVVIAVMSILAAMAVPSMGERLARQRLVGAAEELAADMAEARHQAAQTGTALHLVFGSADGGWCYAVARSAGCDCGSPQPCQLKVVRGRDHAGVALAASRAARFDPAAVDFGTGGAELTGVRGRHAMRVDLSPLGRARLCSSTGLQGYVAC